MIESRNLSRPEPSLAVVVLAACAVVLAATRTEPL